MNDLTHQQPQRKDVFSVTETIESLFKQADQAHRRFEESHEASMATESRRVSKGMQCMLGDCKLSILAQCYYDKTGLDILRWAIKSLAGQERASILMMAERPLRIIPADSNMGMPDVLAQAIAREAKIKVHVPVTSLSDLSVIGEAISIGQQRQVDKIDILGAVVASVAHPLNLGTVIDLKTGVDELRKVVPHEVGILELYQFADEVLNFSPDRLRTLAETIDNASRQVGHVENDGQVIQGGLYVRDILADILNHAPEHRASILGFAVCSACP